MRAIEGGGLDVGKIWFTMNDGDERTMVLLLDDKNTTVLLFNDVDDEGTVGKRCLVFCRMQHLPVRI